MQMSPIEILALIFSVIVLVKMGFLFFYPDSFRRFGTAYLKKMNHLVPMYILGTAIVGYYVFSALSVIEVVAVMLFTHGMLGATLVAYNGFAKELGKTIMKNPKIYMTQVWWSVAFYVVLSLIVLWELFR
jgi:hypothetical protein